MSIPTYQLITKLAEGLLYTTYRGVAHLANGTQRDVVIKHIHPHLVEDPVLVTHLAGYADVARGLLHPGLAPVWDLGQADGHYLFVREYLPGISLQRLFSLVESNQAVLSPAMALYLAREIVDAILAIHRFRVPGEQPVYLFHGGLAPENVILTRIGNVVVTDAGLDVIFWRNPDLAWRLRQRKLAYQPPEYESGERPMRRGDGYGVAALLYQMVMGQSQANHPFVPPSSQHPRITEKFDQLLFQCLHPEVEHRVVQMKELQRAFCQDDLLRQETMEQRDAMAYLEALVSEAFDPNIGSRDQMLFEQSFSLSSMLPNHSYLVPPDKRYRQPIYESTDTFHPSQSADPNHQIEALMNAVNHTDTSQPAEDNLSIGFQDGLGAPLHESSEFAGKTLATAFPEPSKEELEAENAIYEEEQPIDADPVEAINVSAHAVSLPTEEEDEDEEDPGEVTTLAFAPPPDPELLADGPAPLTGEEDTDYLDEPIQVDAAAPEEQEEQVEPLPEEASTEPPSEPEVETAASASLSTLTDGELVSESDEEEPVETLEPIDDEDDEEDDPGEMTSLAPATLTPPAKADQLLSDILDNSMIVDAALAANEEETESGAVPTAPVTEDTPISPLSSQSIPVDGPSEPQATSQLDLSDAVLDEVDDTGEHAAINGHDTASGPPPASAANIGSLSSDVPPHTLGGPDSPVASDYLPASLLSPPTSSGPPPQASAPGSALFAALASPPTPSAPSEPPPPRMPETVALPIEQVIPDALSARASTPVPGTPETVALPLESVIPPEAHAVGGVAQHQHHAQHIAQQQAPMHQHMMQQPAMQHHSAPPSHAPSTESLPVGQERFGKFILLNRVALGGMAEVFRAKFEGPGGFQKLVAIKRILPEYMQDHNFLQMFMDEARIAGSLRHPNIVQIHELGEIEGVFFISMEFIDGIDLARVIKIRRALQVSIPHEIILDIGIAVCRALDYAHKECDPDGRPLRMIHRDVTPHNILISKKGECKLTDFGIAKAARNVAETAVGELKGKISYMSPEQAEGLQLDVRSDIFQVGIVMYEMLTLQKMFEGNSDQSILNKIQTAQFTPPRRLSPGIPKAIQQVVMKALATEPGKRYQSSAELQRALTQCKAQIRIKEPTEIAEFAKDILVQRDELLAQHAAARRQNVQEHGFSRLEHHQPSAQSKPSHTAPKASGQGTRWMIAILVMLLIIGASGTGYLLWNKPKPVPTVGLSVFTNPAGADIYLDKKRIGETPLFEKRFPFDQKIHTVRIEKLGYKPYFRSFQYNAPDDTQGIRVVLVKKGSKTKVFRAPVPRPKTFLPQKMKKK